MEKRQISMSGLIEDPLAWQQEMDSSSSPINMRGSARFWETVENLGLPVLFRDGAPEFGVIVIRMSGSLALKLSTEFEKAVIDYALVDPFDHGSVIADARSCGHLPYLNLANPDHSWNRIAGHRVVHRDGTLDFSEIVIALDDEIGLKFSTEYGMPWIDYRFVDLAQFVQVGNSGGECSRRKNDPGELNEEG